MEEMFGLDYFDIMVVVVVMVIFYVKIGILWFGVFLVVLRFWMEFYFKWLELRKGFKVVEV